MTPVMSSKLLENVPIRKLPSDNACLSASSFPVRLRASRLAIGTYWDGQHGRFNLTIEGGRRCDQVSAPRVVFQGDYSYPLETTALLRLPVERFRQQATHKGNY